MGLRTVGQWKKLARCWTDVADRCESPTTANRRASGSSEFGSALSRPTTGTSTASYPPGNARPRTWSQFLHRRKGVDDDPADESDDEEIIGDVAGKLVDTAAGGEEDLERMDWELLLIRKFFGRWADKAGVRREVCDPDDVEAERIDWTRVVAPVVEGRIKMVPVKSS